MQDFEKPEFVEHLVATAETLGKRLTRAAIDGYFETLQPFPLTPVLLALKEAQREEDRMPVPARIIQRVKSKHMTTSERAGEPNTEWLRRKIEDRFCICGSPKDVMGEAFCLPCQELLYQERWTHRESNGMAQLKQIEAYYLGACRVLFEAGIRNMSNDGQTRGLRVDGGNWQVAKNNDVVFDGREMTADQKARIKTIMDKIKPKSMPPAGDWVNQDAQDQRRRADSANE